MNKIISLLCFCVMGVSTVGFAQEDHVTLDKAPIDLTDYPSLQRGAKLYMNYCSGCHGAEFVRYNSMAKDIGITDEQGNILEEAFKQHLLFVGEKMTDTLQVSMPKIDAALWFGVAPPDLSLVARSRGSNWLYTYLRSFYLDESRPWGVNNLVFPDVAMPHMLVNLQGTKVREIWPPGTPITTAHLKTQVEGSLSEKEYDQMVLDLVNFLTYIGEPVQLKRKKIGVWVLLFLGVFLVFAYLLKREYWKDVK